MNRLIFASLLLLLPSPLLGQPKTVAQKPYAAAVAELDKLAAEVVAEKRLPALSIALIDDQRIVWAKGYGFQDAARKIPASADTIYRVGSVSKLFTDVAVMQLVEQGKLDLDAPLTKYLPEFKPKTQPGYKPITLRMLMAHCSGLVREAPIGNYFDPTGPSLEKSVASLNGISLVYPPGSKQKYSNAAIGVVGYALQKTQNERFEKYVQRAVLDVLGMKASSFEPTSKVKRRLAQAVMWTYHGREFPAPTFELGITPAGCMYSTVNDLARFTSCLFAGGKASGKQLIKPETIEAMFALQLAKKGQKEGFGLGFYVDEFEGTRRVSHNGAVYGFATDWMALPKEKLGVVVVCSRDVANMAIHRIADDALRLMRAAKAGQPLPKIERSQPIAAKEARKLAGRYQGKKGWVELCESFGRLYLTNRYYKLLVRKSGDQLIVDDLQHWGFKFSTTRDGLLFGKEPLVKQKPRDTAPNPPPAKWLGLIGEYGWDHNTLFIFEKDGELHALIEWTEIDPLTQESENVFAFPKDRGMYFGEKLIFTRDESGRATQVVAANVVFRRRAINGENGKTFQIRPERPLDELRQEALAAKPPKERPGLLPPDLVDLATIDGLKFDIRYATENNFLGAKFYSSARAYMQRPAAEALARVHKKLASRGYGLLIHDAYRPWFVTRMFWDATPKKFHNFVANPSKGSRHNRGCAVDLTLYDLKTGKPITMVSGYDEFSDRAFADYMGGSSRQRWHRDLLRQMMHEEGFVVYEEEWWHFDFKDWKKYPIVNKTFEQLHTKGK